MSSIVSLLFTGAALFLLASADAVSAEDFSIRTLARGPFSGIQEPTQAVIKEKAAWAKAWAKHAAGGRADQKLPEVDFSKEMVVLLAMGRQRTGGYAIEVTSVKPHDDRLRIAVARKTPPPDAMTTQALTAPFHFVAVPRSDLKPEFVEGKAVK